MFNASIFILLMVVVSVYYLHKSQQYHTTECFTNYDVKIYLIGDSMLNNKAYVSQKSVETLIREKAKHVQVVMLAKDGAKINDVYKQIDAIHFEDNDMPKYIFLSVGGNDLLLTPKLINNLLDKYLLLVKTIQTDFPNYKLILLNLYYPPDKQYKSFYGLIAKWNQMLISLGVPVIKMDKIMTEKGDIVYGIEPSDKGGRKICDEILMYV